MDYSNIIEKTEVDFHLNFMHFINNKQDLDKKNE